MLRPSLPRLADSSDASSGVTPPLLNPSTFRDTRGTESFRDSALSMGHSDASLIPITWSDSSKEPRQTRPRSPTLPGAWLSPEDEVPEDEDEEEPHGSLEFHPRRHHDITPDRQNVNVGVREIIHEEQRKSTSAEHGQIQLEQRPPLPGPVPVPAVKERVADSAQAAPQAVPRADKGEGWVLVNVNQPSGTAPPSPRSAQSPKHSTRTRGDSRAHPYESRNVSLSGQRPGDQPVPSATPTGESAADTDGPDGERSGGQSHSSIKRIFSTSKKSREGGVREKSKSFEQEERDTEAESSENEAGPDTKRRVGLRERWRRRGVQEVMKVESRKSVD